MFPDNKRKVVITLSVLTVLLAGALFFLQKFRQRGEEEAQAPEYERMIQSVTAPVHKDYVVGSEEERAVIKSLTAPREGEPVPKDVLDSLKAH